MPSTLLVVSAVFQAMHTAGILRHVAADRTGDLAGGVGRVVETLPRHSVRHPEVGHAWLHHHDAIVEVDVEHLVELRHDQEHAVGERQRAAGKRGAGAARNDADAVLVAIAQHAAHLLDRLRQHREHRQLAVGGEAVRLEGSQRVFVRDHALAGDDGAEIPRDRLALGDHVRLRLRHYERHEAFTRAFSRACRMGFEPASKRARRLANWI